MPDVKIAPSILSADFGKINEEIAAIEDSVDYIHIDIMDGHFVPNITFGPPVLKCIRSKKPMDVHLMIENPDQYIDAFVKAGADIITVHAEVCENLRKVIEQIKKAGVKASVALNPASPLSMIKEVLSDVDMVLLMTVNPGFGGQSFIRSVVDKMRELRKIASNIDIEVDGGINAETVKIVKEAGANVFVAGNYIFTAKDRIAAIQSLRV